MDKYIRGKVLGKGSFGCAVQCTNKLDGKSVVIKEVDMSRMPKAEREAAEQEAKVGICQPLLHKVILPTWEAATR